MKRILCIDGGGTKGAAVSETLLSLERRLARPLHEVFDLIIGSSVGAILGGMYAHGGLSAEKANPLFLNTLPAAFAHRIRWPNTPKYSRAPIQQAFNMTFGRALMRDCKTKFICTSVNACDSRNHFFKSWEDKDGSLGLCQAIDRSYAAPMYFGGIVDHQASALWLDGGTGSDNCPVLQAMIESALLGWVKDGEKIHILSIGCGYSSDDMPWSKAEHSGNLAQIGFFMDPADGGLARRQATEEKITFAAMLPLIAPSFTFQRVDFPLTKEQDAMDRLDFIPLYRSAGVKMEAEINIVPLID